jgi:hypothetical protein
MGLARDWTMEMFFAEVDKVCASLKNPRVIPIIKESARSVLKNGNIEYPPDHDPNGWVDNHDEIRDNEWTDQRNARLREEFKYWP